MLNYLPVWAAGFEGGALIVTNQQRPLGHVYREYLIGKSFSRRGYRCVVANHVYYGFIHSYNAKKHKMKDLGTSKIALPGVGRFWLRARFFFS